LLAMFWGMFCGLSSQVFFLVRFWSVVVSVVFAKGSLGAVGWRGAAVVLRLN